MPYHITHDDPLSTYLPDKTLAAKGVTGPQNSLEGKYGLYKTYHRVDYSRKILIADLGKKFDALLAISFKPYPSCRLAHTCVDATLKIVNTQDIRPEDVDEVTVVVGETGQWLCEPLELCQNPNNVAAAQYSIPYNMAVAIVKRNVALNDFIGDGFRDPTVLQIARKIAPKVEPRLTRKGIEPSIVKIKTRGKEVYLERADFCKGDPENPMTMDELVAKFRDCARWAARPVPKENLDKTINMIDNLEEVDDVGQIITLLR